MPTGELLGWFLLGLAFVWGALDFAVWFRGGQTFSQWIITESKKRLSFAMITTLLVIALGVWLILHWDLPEILWSHVYG